MEKLIITVCASKDSFGAYSENCDGIYAAGDTVADVKRDVEEAIRLIKENLPQERWPEVLKGEYSIEWHYDTQSMLQHYSGIITNAALSRLTGINQKQLWNYAHGVSKPRLAQRKKIESALHGLGSELLSISL